MNNDEVDGLCEAFVQTVGVVQRFRQAWEEDSETDLAGFLAAWPEPVSSSVQVALVKLDLDRRWRGNNGSRVEEYLRLWPELSESADVVAELIRAEYVARAVYQTPPHSSELSERFPQLLSAFDFPALDQRAHEMMQRASFARTGRFFLLRRLGAGGMGEVFAAWDRERQGLVAIKTLPTADPELLYRFKREFRALSEVVHPHLIPLYELFSSGNKWFFTMELIEGMDLLSYLRRRESWWESPTQIYYPSIANELNDETHATDASTECHVEVAVLEDLLRQVVLGLMGVHAAGSLHRDVKPSNILVRRDGWVVILDFGLIAELGEHSAVEALVAASDDSRGEFCQSLDQTDWKTVGTAAYMSPEQAGGKPLTPATDWYSVGVILYISLTGQRPFHGSKDRVIADKQAFDPRPPSAVCRGIPPHLDELCLQLLQRDPQRRPSGEEILARLHPRGAPVAGPRTAVSEINAPFVGRHRSLRALHASFKEMLANTLVVVDVCGPTGVGKSRLVRHFLREAQAEQDFVLLHGRCYERESVPYKALDLLVDSLSRYLNSRPTSEVAALLPHGWPALIRLFPVLQRAAAVACAAWPTQEIRDMRELRQRAAQALQELLVRIGQRRPLVLWIDDLQWDDADSAAVLSAILQRTHQARLMLLLSFRSEQRQEMHCLTAMETVLAQRNDPREVCWRQSLTLGPLRYSDAKEMAAELLRDQPQITPDVVQTIARQSQGTPYFVQELVRFALSRDGQPLSSDVLQELDLQKVLTARVGQLPDEQRRILEVLSVAGRPLKLALVHEAAEIDPANRRALVSLRSAHLVRTTGPTLGDEVDVFHDRLRDSVLGLLTLDTLRARHARLAVVLEQAQEDPETIAVHFHRAGDEAAAQRFYTLAAKRAADALAFERAARLYQAALELSPDATDWPPIVRQMADALANAGQGRAAAEAYLRLAATAPADEQLELRHRAAYHFCASGHIAAGRNEFAAILRHVRMRLPRSSHAAIVSLLWHRLLLRLRGLGYRQRRDEELPARQRAKVDITWSVSVGLTMIDTVHAADFQARNLLLALRAGEPYRIVRALAWHASHTATGGYGARWQVGQLLDAAESMMAEVNHPHAEALLAVARGIVSFFQAEWPVALEHCDRGDALLRDNCTGVSWERATAQSFSLWSLYFLGSTAELMQRQPELLRAARQRGDLLAEASLTNLSGTLMWLARNQPQEALDSLAAAMQPWQGLGFRTQHFTSLASHTQIALYSGDYLAASRQLEFEWPALRGSMLLQIEAIRIFMLHLRGSCAVAMARTQPGDRHFPRLAWRCARSLAREPAAWGRALGNLLDAALANLQGDDRRAMILLGAAVADLEKTRLGLYAAAARFRQGQLIGGLAGEELIAQARSWMSDQQVVDCAAMTNVFLPGFPS